MCDVHVNNKLSALLNPPCVPCKATRTARAHHPSARAAHCHCTIHCPFPHLNIRIIHHFVDFVGSSSSFSSAGGRALQNGFILMSRKRCSISVFACGCEDTTRVVSTCQ